MPRSELNELVENLTSLNALEGKFWKSDQKVVMDGKINQNGVVGEELVQNGVIDGKFVKNFVMDAKIDPKVVDLSIFKIGGWKSLQPINQNSLEIFIDENEPFFVDQNSKQRSVPCEPVFGKTLCEFRSAHEEIDVTS